VVLLGFSPKYMPSRLYLGTLDTTGVRSNRRSGRHTFTARTAALAMLAILAALAVLPVDASLALDAHHSLEGVHLTIVTVEDWPFIDVRSCPEKGEDGNHLCEVLPWWDKETGMIAWRGWIIDLIQHLSEQSGFTFTLQLPSGFNIGSRNFTGKQNYGSADHDLTYGNPAPDVTNPTVMFAGAYTTVPRLSRSSITTPFATQPLSLLVKKPDPTFATAWMFAKPFSAELWFTIMAISLGAALVYPMFEGEALTVKESGATAKALLSVMECSKWSPTSRGGKAFSVIWSFCGLMIVALYTVLHYRYHNSNSPVFVDDRQIWRPGSRTMRCRSRP
jgi:hypothetical protein